MEKENVTVTVIPPQHKSNAQMKSLILLFIALAGTFIFTGCSDSDSPRDVAVKWGKALVAKDLKTANKYSTKKMEPLNGMMIGMMSDKEALAEISVDIQKWEKGKEKIDGETAIVFEKDPKDKDAVTLKKVDGNWKVEVQKKNGTDADSK